MNRRDFTQALASLASFPSSAQSTWPAKPLRLIVPAPPGGPNDVIARYLSEQLRKTLGQPMLVDNKPGAGGNITLGELVRSPADGYTLAIISTGTTSINSSIDPNLPYDPEAVQPIAMLASLPFVLVARNGLPSNLNDLLEAIKAKPGSFNAAYAQVTGQVGNEMLKKSYGLDFVSIPYKGDVAALTALLSGEADIYFAASGQLKQLVEEGKLQAIAVAGAQRHPLLPKTPTFAEAGRPNFFAINAWFGIAAQRGLPAAIATRLNQEISRVAASPEFAERLRTMGMSPLVATLPQSAELVAKERVRWGEPLKAMGIKPN